MIDINIAKLAVQYIEKMLKLNIGLGVVVLDDNRKNCTKSYYNNNTLYINANTGNEFVKLVLHEIVHMVADSRNIMCTSKNGRYHNKKYKQIANKLGLKVENVESSGFCDIIIPIQLYDIVNKINDTMVNREGQIEISDSELKKKCSTRKYICPSCQNSIRATKDVNIICGDCGVTLIKCSSNSDSRKTKVKCIKQPKNKNELSEYCLSANINYKKASAYHHNHKELTAKQVIIYYRPDCYINILGQLVIPQEYGTKIVLD